MFNSFNTGTEDQEVRLQEVGYQVRGLLPSAVEEAARRFSGGLVEGHNRAFPPSVAQFAEEARKLDRIARLPKAKPLPAPSYRGPAPFQIREHRLRDEYRNHPVIKTNVDHGEAKRMSASGEIPVGGCWVAALQTVYGPKQ